MKRIFLLIAIALGAAGGGFAQTRTVSLPDTAGVPGTVMQLPVRIGGVLPADGVTSAQFTFTYPESQFELLGVSLTGTLLEGTGTAEFSANLKRVAVATPDTLSGDGVLFLLNLRIRPSAGKYATHAIGFSEAQLNEGVPALATDAGSIRVKGITLQPGFVNNLLLTDTLAFGLTGDGLAPYSWSVSNSDIATIGSDGVLRPQTLGFVRVLVQDAQGLRDSTNLFRIQPAALADLEIAMPDTTIRQTRELRLPVRTTDLTGIGATSVEMVLEYNPSALTYLGLDTTGGKLQTGAPLVAHVAANRIRIAYAADTPFEGSGTLFALRFRVSATYQGGTTVSFVEAVFNEDLFPERDHASVNIQAAPPISITPNPVHTTPGRTVALQVGGQGTPPYTYEVETPGVVERNGAELTGLMRGTTRVRAVDAEGFPSPWVPVEVFDVEARLPDTTVVYPDTMRIPLTVESLTGLGVTSMEAVIRFDSTLFRWLDAEAGALTAGMTMETERQGNDIRVAFAGTADVAGAGTVLQLRFLPRSGTGNLVRMPLTLVRLRFNEASATTATAQLIGGGITNDWNWQPPSAPKNLMAEAGGGVEIGVLLTWETPDTNGGRPITDYVVEYRDTSAATAEWTVFNDGVSAETMAFVTSLPFRSVYAFRVAAVNSVGRGADSAPDTLSWGFSEPGAPSALQAEPVPGTEVVVALTWQAPADDGGYAITDYVVEYRRSGDTEWILVDDGVSAEPGVVIGGLEADQTYEFRVAAVNQLGRGHFNTPVSATSVDDPMPLETALVGNFPNPFNPTTAVRYQLTVDSRIRLAVYDLLGREVAVLVDGVMPAGAHRATFDAAGLASGVYLYRLDADGRVFTRTMLLVK